jgi:hypothetical protein
MTAGVEITDKYMEFPDGGLRAWLVVFGVRQLFGPSNMI